MSAYECLTDFFEGFVGPEPALDVFVAAAAAFYCVHPFVDVEVPDHIEERPFGHARMWNCCHVDFV